MLHEALRALHVVSVRIPNSDQFRSLSKNVKEQQTLTESTPIRGEFIDCFVKGYYDSVILYLSGLIM